jgi:RNA recognition motif-containing protein
MATSQSPEPSRKRKRGAEAAEEIEIDISLPEPLSKKALRKSKKSKPAANPEVSQSAGTAPTETAAEVDSKPAARSAWGVWIGNLPWTATKPELRDFFVKNAALAESQITRVHMPAPPAQPESKFPRPKQHNKGFAYVDFSGQEALDAALQLSEQIFGGRAVLIKNSQSFEGRPAAEDRVDKSNNGKPPSKRVFVGNLGFDVTKEDLEKHYNRVGTVADIHMATFEDSGNCKGFAWVTFQDIKAAEAAVRGWKLLLPEDEKAPDARENSPAEGNEADPPKNKRKEPKKPKKITINRLGDRVLRCEFAEDPSVRYKKRFGKDREKPEGAEGNDDVKSKPEKERTENSSHDRRREARKAGKVDARTIRPGAAHMNAPRASVSIVEGKGKKISFD